VDLIRSTLKGLELGPPVEGELLTVYPLLCRAPAEPWYDLARDAFVAKALEITELSDGGSVPTLKVTNRGAKPVLLLDGEELIGAKQNRVLNVTVMVPATQTIAVPVSCVEAGRWHYRARTFHDADWLMNKEGRARKMRRVRESMRDGSRAGSQGDVWEHIESKAARMDAQSDTGAQEEIFARHRRRMHEDEKRFVPGPTQVGAIFVTGGRIGGLELMDAPATFGRIMQKLVLSHAIDAIELRARPRWRKGEDDVREFLAAMQALETEWYPAVGLGREARLTGPGLTGAALVAEDRLVHLTVLEDVESMPAPGHRPRPHAPIYD
jgi:hypothetical protein